MINTLVTILIPSNNTLEGLKSTLNSILLQTKIKGTSVIILDYGSSDGSVQYAAQASSDFYRTIKIECLDFKEKNPQFGVYTPYCFWVSPGVVLEDRDFLMEEINSNTITNKSCAYTIDNTKEFFKSFFPHYYINKGQMEITSVLCKNAERSMIKNVKNGNFFNFSIDNTISRKNYRISKSRIKKSSIFFY